MVQMQGLVSFLLLSLMRHSEGGGDSGVILSDVTSKSEAYEEERPWCPPAGNIYPCTCDGPQIFLMLTCDRIDNAHELNRVTRSVDNVKNFGKFSLTNSRLTSFETNLLNFLSFEYIYARKNTVRTVESVFFESSREDLKRIELIHNDIEKFPFKELATFPKLEYIDLQYNSLKKIPDEAFGKTLNNKLKKLNLSFNMISHIGSNAFKYLYNLEELDLRFNRLTVLNNYAFAAYRQNPELSLNLANNKVMFISEGAFNNQIFKSLNLSENNLGKFPENIFRSPLTRMAERNSGVIYAYHNRLLCTCENVEWFVRLPSYYKTHVVGLTCADRDNKNIQDLTIFELGCPES